MNLRRRLGLGLGLGLRGLGSRNRIPIYERTTIWRWRYPQSKLGRTRTIGIVAVVAGDGRSEQRDSSGGGRHDEIVLPLTRQKQLVGVSGSSQTGGIVGGHFGDGLRKGFQAREVRDGVASGER